MKRLILAIAFIATCFTGKSQHTIEGTIEYTRSLNIHRTIDYMDEDRKEWISKFRDKVDKYSITYFNLSFNTKHSVYEPRRESDQVVNSWFARIPAEENIVYTDYLTKNVIAQKQVYEEKFLVKDSMRKLEWKIEDEVRTIANYKCRKAVAVMCDSVYVVAFYSEDIPVSGGPEMFGNLPGMILEIAVPRLHTTWIASKVDIATPEEKKLTPPKKGKEVKVKDMYDEVYSSLERWGKYGERVVWWAML